MKALNTIRGRLAQALNDANTPPYVYNGLKREQLIRTGSVVLHELYFANLGGDGKARADLRTRLAASFGTYDAWESELREHAFHIDFGAAAAKYIDAFSANIQWDAVAKRIA